MTFLEIGVLPASSLLSAVAVRFYFAFRQQSFNRAVL